MSHRHLTERLQMALWKALCSTVGLSDILALLCNRVPLQFIAEAAFQEYASAIPKMCKGRLSDIVSAVR